MTTLEAAQAAPRIAEITGPGRPAPMLICIGRGGALIYYKRRFGPNGAAIDERRSTWPASDDVAAALDAGCPLIDTRPMAYAAATEFAMKGPLVDQTDGAAPGLFGCPAPGLGLDGCGYHAMMRAPVAVVARLAAARGAYVSNVEGV